MTNGEAIDELFWIREDENDLKGKEALEIGEYLESNGSRNKK